MYLCTLNTEFRIADKINWQNFRMDNVYVVGENVKLHRLFQD